MKIFVKILLMIEIVITFSILITWGFYDHFWQINDYAFTWFWLKGFLGIVLFFIGSKKEYFKNIKNNIEFIIPPIILSVFLFIFIIWLFIAPSYGFLKTAFQYSLLAFGFPLWIIFILQNKFEINKILILISSILTPVAYFTVIFNIWIR
ncbi:hypothetical protein FACS189476_00580 [Spirochaetia bacterium]|nr:hypothetical protein FACS189476_00580 [Spirochaetia bacterium]